MPLSLRDCRLAQKRIQFQKPLCQLVVINVDGLQIWTLPDSDVSLFREPGQLALKRFRFGLRERDRFPLFDCRTFLSERNRQKNHVAENLVEPR